MTHLHLDASEYHAFWDNSLQPRGAIRPGDTVSFETREGTGQVAPTTSAAKLASLDPATIHPLTGPVYVEGAEPGDALIIDVVSLEHSGWGWNGVIPGFGLLADDFPQPYIHHYSIEGGTCIFRPDIRIPYAPFCGVMGVAPAEQGRFDTAPPRTNGGNIDIRQLTPGARVLIPVRVEGALFSCGDCHAAQGDGEVNGTGIETPMIVTLRIDLQKGKAPAELSFRSPPASGDRGWFVTTAHGPDLFECAKRATRYMLDYLVDDHDLTREQAYCLAGAAVDLRISEIVNEPNWIVSAHLPLAIFQS